MSSDPGAAAPTAPGRIVSQGVESAPDLGLLSVLLHGKVLWENFILVSGQCCDCTHTSQCLWRCPVAQCVFVSLSFH